MAQANAAPPTYRTYRVEPEGFNLDEQILLIAKGIENLRACGVETIHAFRAGNYGANFDTLRALCLNGIPCDTSYNFCYLSSSCDMRTGRPLLQPALLHGVWEVPVSFFQNLPGHYRHTQLCACSSDELRRAIYAAEQGWQAFVIVSHSFELLQQTSSSRHAPGPDTFVIKRFERLCRFLADSVGFCRTVGFADLTPGTEPPTTALRYLRGSVLETASRVGEQLRRRFA